MSDPTTEAARLLSVLGASKGGKARAASLTPERRREIGQNAARARWGEGGEDERSRPI
jgi:hypothetical protein